MSEMTLLRKSDISLYYHIKDVVLKNFLETDELAQLALISDMCEENSYVYECVTNVTPSPTARGRGWCYFDIPVGGLTCEPYPSVSGTNGDGNSAYGTPEQSDRVKVYETTSSGLSLVSWKDYMIDYIDGRIISTRKLNSPKVTYTWNYVSVVDEWAAIEASEPPVVVIDMHGTDKKGYQLGHGTKIIRKVDIHIFASNPAERNDIVETLYDGLYLRSTPLFNFNTGTVLYYDGTFYGRSRLSNPLNKLTYLFDREQVQDVSQLQFDSVTARHVNLPLAMSRGVDTLILSDLNAYRSKISLDVVLYDDRKGST